MVVRLGRNSHSTVPCESTLQCFIHARSGDGSDITTIGPVGFGENFTVSLGVAAMFNLSHAYVQHWSALTATPSTPTARDDLQRIKDEVLSSVPVCLHKKAHASLQRIRTNPTTGWNETWDWSSTAVSCPRRTWWISIPDPIQSDGVWC